ncbi:putative NAD dependent epimerase/dehydratase [Nemania sp. FL0031]|nr:putative NAD dependent epimerase/dehydratase [Nemania sp. FL0031]
MSTPKQQRIFVTGATGYIGSRFVAFALRSGFTVHGLSRSAPKAATLRALGAVPVTGDLTSLSVLRAEAAQADIVVHLADAWIDDFSQPYANVIATDAAAVDAMVSGLAESRSERKLFVGTSGVGVVERDAGDGETDEEAPPSRNPMNGRIHCEQHILSKAGYGSGDRAGKGVSVCIMRLPPFVYGRGGSGIRLFMNIFAKLGFVVRIGSGETKTCVVHVDDAARAYVLALEHACVRPGNENENEIRPGREIYNVTSSTEVTFREFTGAIADAMGLPLREMGAAEAAETAGPLVAGFFSDRVRGSGEKARRELGWEPREIGVVEDIRGGSYVQAAKEVMSAAGRG